MKYLDLSMNDFGGINIPEFMGSFHQLQYLNLSRAGLGGLLPHQLGNLSNLQYLDLYNDLDPNFVVPVREFSIGDALWISHLSSLKHLNLKSVNFQNGTHWLEALNMLPSIVEIYLSLCEIGSVPLSLPHVNFTSQSVLDLSYNFINSTIPSWLFNISGLEHLDLIENFFQGNIPPAFGNLASLKGLNLANNPLQGGIPTSFKNLCKLRKLDEIFSGCIKMSLESLYLSETNIRGQLPEWLFQLRKLKSLYLGSNLISGPIPVSIGQLASLQELFLGQNQLNETIPESVGWLSQLVSLDLQHNNLEGVMSEAHFGNLTELKDLYLSSNSLALKVKSNWLPPFQLESLRMDSCKQGPEFPAWLQSQKNISEIDMSNASIIDAMPDWFWSLISTAEYLPLSLKDCKELVLLDAGHNDLKGKIPTQIGESLTSLRFLNLRSNMLVRDIPPNLSRLSALQFLDLADNKLSGTIPRSFGNFTAMKVIGKFSSRITDYKEQMLVTTKGRTQDYEKSLSLMNILDLSDNNLFGEVLEELVSLFGLFSLNLSGNHFTGEIIENISKLQQLESLDLSRNNFSGTIPWPRCPDLFGSLEPLGNFSW
ncbi:unnamed protein product [Musa acuminata var. zebrina]